MRTLIDNKEVASGNEYVRLDRHLEVRETKDEFPEKVRWAIQVSYFDGDKWKHICRADNHLHKGQTGSHIHTFNPEFLRRKDITYEEADRLVKNMSAKILKDRFGVVVEFE